MEAPIRILVMLGLTIAASSALAEEGRHHRHAHDVKMNAHQARPQPRIPQRVRTGEPAPDERKDPNQDMNKASGDIRGEKHDAGKR